MTMPRFKASKPVRSYSTWKAHIFCVARTERVVVATFFNSQESALLDMVEKVLKTLNEPQGEPDEQLRRPPAERTA